MTLTAEDHCPYLIHHEIVPEDEEVGEYDVQPCNVFAPTLKSALRLRGPTATGATATPPEAESGSPDHTVDSGSPDLPSGDDEEETLETEVVDNKIKDTLEAFNVSHADKLPL